MGTLRYWNAAEMEQAIDRGLLFVTTLSNPSLDMHKDARLLQYMASVFAE